MAKLENFKKVVSKMKYSVLTYFSIILTCLLLLTTNSCSQPSESPHRIEDVPSISFGKTTESFRFKTSSFTIIKWLKEPVMSFGSGHTILAVYDENGRLYDEAVLYESFFDIKPELIGDDTIIITQKLNDLNNDSSIDYYSNSDLKFTRSKLQLVVEFTTYKEEVLKQLQENEHFLEISRDDLVYKGSGSSFDSSYTLFEVGTDQIKIVRKNNLETIWINDSIWKTISVNLH